MKPVKCVSILHQLCVCVSVSQAALLEGVELCPKDRKIDQCRQKMWRRERCLLCMQSVPKSCDSRMESDIQKVMLWCMNNATSSCKKKIMFMLYDIVLYPCCFSLCIHTPTYITTAEGLGPTGMGGPPAVRGSRFATTGAGKSSKRLQGGSTMMVVVVDMWYTIVDVSLYHLCLICDI